MVNQISLEPMVLVTTKNAELTDHLHTIWRDVNVKNNVVFLTSETLHMCWYVIVSASSYLW